MAVALERLQDAHTAVAGPGERALVGAGVAHLAQAGERLGAVDGAGGVLAVVDGARRVGEAPGADGGRQGGERHRSGERRREEGDGEQRQP
ncbi:hypothetical protein EJB05_49567, partial [Eragrostis curvula]